MRRTYYILGLLLAAGWQFAFADHPTAVEFRNTGPNVSFMGSKECSLCHTKIYRDYIRTPMGRSMGLASDANQLEKVPAPFTVISSFFNRAYTVFREGSYLYESEQEFYSGTSHFIPDRHKLEYVIGSGLHGHTYLVNREDYLFQAPLSFYSKTRRWDLSPGYEFAEFGFDRPISRGCLTCHTNTKLLLASKGFQVVPNRAASNQELAIGCENCHGPGQLHIAERRQAIKLAGNTDTSIVNPAELPPQLAEDICMSCHQGKDLRILQPGRDFSDFRPGRPLRETLAIFAIVPERN